MNSKAFDKAYLAQMAKVLLPGWSVKLHGNETMAADGLSSVDCFLHIVDSALDWQLLSAVPSKDFDRIGAEARRAIASGLNINDAASAAFLVAANEGRPGDAVKNEQAGVAAALYVSQTMTAQLVVSQTGGMAGQWVVMVYRTRKGDAVVRPAFISTHKRPLDVEVLLACAKTLCHLDLVKQRGQVAAQVEASGGAVLRPGFEPGAPPTKQETRPPKS